MRAYVIGGDGCELFETIVRTNIDAMERLGREQMEIEPGWKLGAVRL